MESPENTPQPNPNLHEELVRYHNASKMDLNPGSKEESDYLAWEQSYNAREKKINEYKEKHVQCTTPGEQGHEIVVAGAVERIKEIIDILDSIQLKKSVENDPQQVSLLEQKKHQAKNLIHRLLENDVVDYVSLVRAYNVARIDVQNKDLTPQEFEDYNERRRIKHDSLISSLTIISRFITQNFGTMSEEDLDLYEEHEEENNRDFLEVERTQLPPNVICPDYIDMSIREEITDWALDVSRSLANINF